MTNQTQAIKTIRVGDEFPSGNIVIALHQCKDHSYVVLELIKHVDPVIGNYHEYVSHLMDREGCRFFGHYNTSFLEAVEDYKSRIEVHP